MTFRLLASSAHRNQGGVRTGSVLVYVCRERGCKARRTTDADAFRREPWLPMDSDAEPQCPTCDCIGWPQVMELADDLTVERLYPKQAESSQEGLG